MWAAFNSHNTPTCGHHGYLYGEGSRGRRGLGEWLGSWRGELAVLARLCALPLPPPSHLGGVPTLLSFVLWHVQGLSMASAQQDQHAANGQEEGGVAI